MRGLFEKKYQLADYTQPTFTDYHSQVIYEPDFQGFNHDAFQYCSTAKLSFEFKIALCNFHNFQQMDEFGSFKSNFLQISNIPKKVGPQIKRRESAAHFCLRNHGFISYYLGIIHILRNAVLRIFRPPYPHVTQNHTNTHSFFLDLFAHKSNSILQFECT
jgi:hypothetical protein